MTLLQKIKNDQLAARKAVEPVKASVLTCIIGEVDRQKDKDITDEQLIVIIKKFISNNEDTIAKVDEVIGNHFKAENEILKQYIPEQLDENRIRREIDEYLDHSHEMNHSLKHIMIHFKTFFAGLYDGGVVKRIAEEKLK